MKFKKYIVFFSKTNIKILHWYQMFSCFKITININSIIFRFWNIMFLSVKHFKPHQFSIVTNKYSFCWGTERWWVLLFCLMLLSIYTQSEQDISHTLLLHKLPPFVEKHKGAYVWGVNGRLLSWYPSLCYLQKSSSGTTHSPFRWNRLRFHKGVYLWLLIQSLSPEAAPDLQLPVFAWNYYQI